MAQILDELFVPATYRHVKKEASCGDRCVILYHCFRQTAYI